jgi:hypothetical protein
MGAAGDARRKVRRRPALGLLSVAAAAAVLTTPLPASAAAQVTARGSAAGALAAGSTLRVVVHVTERDQWQRIAQIEVSLRLRGQPLDQLRVFPPSFSIQVVGGGPPASLGAKGILQSRAFFRVDNGKATVSAKGGRYDLTFPIHLLADPPPGARLFLQAQDVIGDSTKLVTLSPPVLPEHQGFPWGTLATLAAAALFIGAFVGNTFSTRRAKRRPPSIYATVQRRLDQERAKR